MGPLRIISVPRRRGVWPCRPGLADAVANRPGTGFPEMEAVNGYGTQNDLPRDG